jgi:dynein heavy chain
MIAEITEKSEIAAKQQ